MNFAWRISSLLVLASVERAQAPQPRQRDLKYEEDAPINASAAIPRSYALIVGVAKYANLPRESQLDYSERDADSIYSILINPEGGGFKAENVHRLTGPK